MTDAITYQIIAYSAMSFIAGAAAGGYAVMRLTARQGDGRPAQRRDGSAWARADVQAPPAVHHGTFVRVGTDGDDEVAEVDYCASPTRTFSFSIKDGLDRWREVTVPAGTVLAFFRADDLTRKSVRIGHGDYSLLLRVGERYRWLYREGRRAYWTAAFQKRERRMRAYQAWCSRTDLSMPLPPPAPELRTSAEYRDALMVPTGRDHQDEQ